MRIPTIRGDLGHYFAYATRASWAFEHVEWKVAQRDRKFGTLMDLAVIEEFIVV